MDNELTTNTGAEEVSATEEVTKTYTQEEVDALLQKESDRRVSQALKSAEKKNADKLKEAQRLASMSAEEKSSFNPNRIPDNFFSMMSLEEKNKYIKEHPEFGHTICRCESVTEGEILHALHTNPKAHDLDGVKRRTRAQMGRCQGGFCLPLVMQIIAEEAGILLEDVKNSTSTSDIVFKDTK